MTALGGKMLKSSINMRHWALGFIFIVSLTVHSQEKTGASADIYEKEESATKSFSARVNMIRETDVIEVFFDGSSKGPFLLKDDPNLGIFKERLTKSQKNKSQSVNVQVKDEVITNVELAEAKAAPQNKKSDLNTVLDDILKK